MCLASVGRGRGAPGPSARPRAWTLALLGVLALAAPLSGQRPDPRSRELRRELAREPARRHAVWVLFDPGAARSSQGPALSAEVLRQRRRSGLPLDEADYPVPARLVRRVERAGGHVRVVSRWLRGVSAEVDSATAARLARLPEVRRIEPVGVFRRAAVDEPTGAAAMAAAVAADTFWGANFDALQALNIPLANATFTVTGKNVRIAIFDTGFNPAHESLAPLRVVAKRDFIQGDTIVRDQAGDRAGQQSHGTLTWSILGGKAVGRLVGPAYDAEFVLAKTEDDTPGFDSHADEDRWVAAAEWAVDSVGVQIISSSLGYRYNFPEGDYPYATMNGDSTPTTKAADIAARKGVLVVNSTGNRGPAPGSLSAPADADSIIAVGAVTALDSVASFSGRGPTADADHRVKPDLVARGVNVTGADGNTTSAYRIESGTSVATPFIAGAAALVKQAWPELGPIAIRNALMLAGSRRVPDNAYGAGVPDVASAILFPDGLAPSQIEGADPLGTVSSIAPTFSWAAKSVYAVRPITYTVQIARDTTFRALVATDTISDAANLPLRRPLRPQSGLFWRVVARKGAITRTSVAAGPFAVPRWVRLDTLNGPDTTYAQSPLVALRWTPLATGSLPPLTYDVQILSPTGAPLRTVSGIKHTHVQLGEPLAFNTPYRWRVIARTADSTAADTVASLKPFVVRGGDEPATTVLYPTFPNPFPRDDVGGTQAHIWFDVGERATVELTIYDLHGRVVRRLAPANGSCGPVTLDAGVYGRTGDVSDCVITTWDATDDGGRKVPRGVYILRLRVGGTVQTRHIVYAGEGS
ncbi:MAG TPA: S8 family serine peptidase [Longimicrobiales bacterium]|nr:S8 family serine peptidase [Longimicrobiales bacterium]